MISKEEFIDLINWYEEQEEEVTKLCSIFPTAFESRLIDNPYRLYELTWNICFTTEGKEWVEWWLYDTCDRQYMNNGEIISVETSDDLWELVKDYRK